MSSEDYLKMVEIPVDTVEVLVKPSKKKKKDVKDEVIQKINDDVSVVESKPKTEKSPFSLFNKAKRKKKVKAVTPVESETTTVKSSRFDIVSVQVVAIFVLVVGIILTNIFLEDSGMNNLLKSVFGTQTESSLPTAEYSAFEPLSPSKTGEVTLEEGVMTVSSGSVYSPCDGVIESVEKLDGKYVVTVRHSDSFTTVISGLELCYAEKGSDAYSYIALGYSGESVEVSMFNENSLITEYSLEGDEIVWLA